MLQGNVSCVCVVCVWCVCSIYLRSGWPSTRVAKYYKGMCGVCVCAVYTWALGGRLTMWPNATRECVVCVCSIYLGFGWLSNHVTKCYKEMCHVCIWCVCSIYLGSGWPSACVAKCYVSCVCVVCVQYIPGLWVAVYPCGQMLQGGRDGLWAGLRAGQGQVLQERPAGMCLVMIIIMGT